MTETRHPAAAETPRGARPRRPARGGGARGAVEPRGAEWEKTPPLGRRAQSASGGMKIYTTRLEASDTRPALTVTYVYDVPPPEPGLIRIALVSPVRFAGGGAGF